MSVTLMNGVTLTAGNQASSALMVSGSSLELWFTIVVTVGTVSVAWFMEFTDEAPTGTSWFRETAEEDAGAGVVLMPEVVRTFADNGGATLGIGTHRLACPFVRPGPLARVQIGVTGAGTAVCTIKAPFGTLAA